MPSFNDFDGGNRVVWESREILHTRCRACGQICNMCHVITTAHSVADEPDVPFFRCPECKSLNASVAVFTDYDTCGDSVGRGAWTAHYLQVGAGIDSMIRPLQRSNVFSGSTMIDVGCGFGFAVSYWNWAGGTAFGLEPSFYGQLGSCLLDANIFPSYLDGVRELASRTFDRVFSSEVIEHLNDVDAFVSQLAQSTSENGVLILTTPNAAFIQPEKDWGAIVAALSPGKHRLLFSSHALHNLLVKYGFGYVNVQEHNERLVAYASRSPLVIEELPELEKRNYLSYLIDMIKSKNDTDLRGGLLFRAFKEQVNFGDLTRAASTFKALQVETFTSHRVDLTDLESVLNSVRGATNIDEFGVRVPFFTPAVLFYAAMASLGGASLVPDAAEAFSTSMKVTEVGYQIAPDLFQEAASLYWLAKLHIAIAHINNRYYELARGCLEAILSADPSEQHVAPISTEVLLRAKRELGVVALQTGEPEKAREIFKELLSLAPSMEEDLKSLHREAGIQARVKLCRLYPQNK